jgi:thiamine kinase-like enzyme
MLPPVGGVSLHNLSAEELRNPRLLEDLQDMYKLLTDNGVVHGDPQFHNFLRVGEKIVAIDFESSCPLPQRYNE